MHTCSTTSSTMQVRVSTIVYSIPFIQVRLYINPHPHPHPFILLPRDTCGRNHPYALASGTHLSHTAFFCFSCLVYSVSSSSFPSGSPDASRKGRASRPYSCIRRCYILSCEVDVGVAVPAAAAAAGGGGGGSVVVLAAPSAPGLAPR